jgi:hypothetical protein
LEEVVVFDVLLQASDLFKIMKPSTDGLALVFERIKGVRAAENRFCLSL